jgi:hypothetical protein
MYKYGINNVKGGSYTDEYLCSSQIENIRKEFEFIENPYRFHSEMSDILIIYNNYIYNSLKQIEQLIQDISQNYQNYLFERNRYQQFFSETSLNISTYITDIDIDDFEWILYQIENHKVVSSLKNIIFDNDKVRRYKRFLDAIKHLYFIITHTDIFDNKKDYIYKYLLYIQYPQFLFDPYIFNTYSQNSLVFIKEVYDIIMYIYNVAINRISEYKFDLSTYDDSIEWKVPRILYILENRKIQYT